MFARLILAILGAQVAVAAATYTYDSAGRLVKVDYGAAGSVSYTYDGAGHLIGRQAVQPTTTINVSGVTSSTANGTYGVGAAISIQVTFSGAVNVTGVPQLALNSGGTANYGTGSGTAIVTFGYTVTAGQNSAKLDYTSNSALTLNGGTIKDASGNAANLTLPSPGAAGSLSASKNIVISTQPVTPPGSPSVVSLAPAASAGVNQTLTVTYSTPGGYQTLGVVNVLINTFLDGRQACYMAYSRPDNMLYIVPDNGDGSQITGKVMDGTGTVSNSQCFVNLAGSSTTGSGNTLTLSLNMSFSPTFAGNKVIYAAARDTAQNNSGWQTMGVHGVPPLPSTFPNPIGMSPSSGNGLNQTLTFTYQDQSNATNLETVWALINTAIDGRAACYVAYYRPGNLLFLYPDNGDGSQATSIALTGTNTISNSQCTISAQGSNVQTILNGLTVTLPITFKTAFAGFKGVWMAAYTQSGAVSPWQALGAWVVPGQ